MIQNNYFSDNEDVVLFFDEIIDWSEIVEEYEHGFKDAVEYKKTGNENLAFAPIDSKSAIENYRMILDSTGEITGKEIAPRSQAMDKTGLKYNNGTVTFPEEMEQAVQAVIEAGLLPYSVGRKYGGVALSASATAVFQELLARADATMAITIGCFNLAETVQRFGSEEMKNEWIPKMVSGEVCGAMALTEPNYGSDLPNVRTKAVKNEKGEWLLTGTKRFITHGCGFAGRPSAILTLARTGEPTSGARGLSFFLVPSTEVHIAKIEEKMGLHCSPTCEVVYENSKGELIGEVGHGLVKYAMGMMNSARLSIAAQAMGIAEAARQEAHKYAGVREQFGKLIKNIPAVRRILDTMDREVFAMRSLMMESGRSVDKYFWRSEHLAEEGVDEKTIRKDEKIRRWEKLASFFTPLTKFYNSEGCVELASNALQIHGGSGYTEEYDVARIYRDSRITTIYEGTTQLQVVAAIGGIVSGMTPNGILREYIDEELGKFKPSALLGETRSLFEECVALFKDIKDGETRDTLAFEVVQGGARFINGLLMERNVSRIRSADRKTKYVAMARAYQIDSKALLSANLVRIKEGTAVLAPV